MTRSSTGTRGDSRPTAGATRDKILGSSIITEPQKLVYPGEPAASDICSELGNSEETVLTCRCANLSGGARLGMAFENFDAEEGKAVATGCG